MSKNGKVTGLSSEVALGRDGPRLRANGQVVEHRDNQGALTRSKAAPGVASDDVAVVSQLTGGASFGMFNPLVAPASPDLRDIETWTNLPTGWSTWTPGPTGPSLALTPSVDRGALALDLGTRPANTGPGVAAVFREIPTDAEWAAYARLTLIGPRTAPSVFLGGGFALAEDVVGASLTSWFEGADLQQLDSNSIETRVRSASYTDFTAGAATNSGAPGDLIFAGSYWLRLRKTNPSDLTSYAADYSTDGIRWQSMHNGASFSLPGAPQHLLIYARSVPSGTTTAPGYRIVVGPVRFATGSNSNNLTSLIPAGT